MSAKVYVRAGPRREAQVVTVAQAAGSCAQRPPEVSAERRVPCGEGMQRDDFGVVLAGAVAEFGEGRIGPVAKLSMGERGDQSGLPGAGSRLRAEGRRLADSGVVEAVMLP